MTNGSKLRSFLFTFLFNLFTAHFAVAQLGCRKTPGLELVVLKTIHIQTYVIHNTTFPVDGALTISVPNAPTNFELITTYTSRSIAKGDSQKCFFFLSPISRR